MITGYSAAYFSFRLNLIGVITPCGGYAFQMIPVFVLEIFRGFYGFPGLFTAAVFSASLRFEVFYFIITSNMF